jgi:hypothetical protein
MTGQVTYNPFFRSSYTKIRRSPSPCCPSAHETRNFRPTEMVRDMRGMRGKSRGLVDVCIGWRPKSVGTVLAGEAFASDGAHRHELLQGGIHALARYAVAASVGPSGVLGVSGEPALRPILDKILHGILGEDMGHSAACAPDLRRYRNALLAGKRAFSTPAACRSG